MCFKKILNHLFGLSLTDARDRQHALSDRNDAASTLAWSLRELFKHRGQPGQPLSPRDQVGWEIAQILSEEAATGDGSTVEFLDHPMRLRRRTDDPGIHDLSKRIAAIRDPVITALWEIGTLRSISDLLTHLILREATPAYLLWNTTDYCKRHNVDLYAINDRYLRLLTNSEPSGVDETTALLFKIWPITTRGGSAADYYHYEAEERIHVTRAALKALGVTIPLTDVAPLLLNAVWLECLQRQLEDRAPDAEELRQLTSYLDRFRRPVIDAGDGAVSGNEIDIERFKRALGPIGECAAEAQSSST